MTMKFMIYFIGNRTKCEMQDRRRVSVRGCDSGCCKEGRHLPITQLPDPKDNE